MLFHGRSLGGGTMCALARHHSPQALLLESTFTGARRMGREMFGPLALLARNPFDNQSLVEGFEGPVLVIHGEQDEVIPYDHGVALARAAPHGRLVSRRAHHADLPRDASYWAEIHRLLEDAGLLP